VIKEFIETLGFEVEQSARPFTNKRYECDLIVKDHNGEILIGVEVNGLYWHSDAIKPNMYHRDKTKMATESGFRLVHIWEDEILFSLDKVKSYLFNILVEPSEVLYGRKVQVLPIEKSIAKAFLDKNHIQSSCNSSFDVGIFDDKYLVGVSSFVKKTKTVYELARHSTTKTVIGGLGKVTKFAMNSVDDCSEIISFCDLAKYQGGSYELAGYKMVKTLSPDYCYRVGQQRKHKFGFRKSLIKSKYPDIYSPELTEREMTELIGLNRIYDCGKLKFSYKL
jgi:hypothetical protein